MELRIEWRAALIGVILLGSGATAQQEYCSSQNTGAEFQGGKNHQWQPPAIANTNIGKVYDIYQSNGACYDQCKSEYAFAIVQYKQCWCSNYIPADQQSIGDCSQECPGYPEELCGNQSGDLYGYVALPNPPSGTMGGSSSQAPSTSRPVRIVKKQYREHSYQEHRPWTWTEQLSSSNQAQYFTSEEYVLPPNHRSASLYRYQSMLTSDL